MTPDTHRAGREEGVVRLLGGVAAPKHIECKSRACRFRIPEGQAAHSPDVEPCITLDRVCSDLYR